MYKRQVAEGDSRIIELLNLDDNEKHMIDHITYQMEKERGLDKSAAIADMRFRFISKVCEETVVKAKESKSHKRSSRIDKILTGKYTAIPSFILIMGLVFFLTFNVIGARLQSLLEMGIDKLGNLVDGILRSTDVNPVIHSLVIDGIFTGVGSVLSFLPIIITLFFFLSILEDSGYMARVAFVMDKILRKIGLSGRSIVPMLIGFGCTVPGVMSSRTLSSERDRKMTILLTPFMSCSAKLPIYVLFTSLFFKKYAALVMILLYIGGILTGILVAIIMKNMVFKGNPVPFVMELPNYRMPGMKNVIMLLWEKAKDFLQNLIREKDMPPKPTLDIDMAEFCHMRNLMIKVQDRAREIKTLQDKVLPQLKQQLANTKGIFKGKERKALEVKIKETEVEIADRLDKIPDTLKGDGYPDVQVFMRTFREMESVVEQYNHDLAQWEYQVSRKPTATAKEQHRPPEKQSVLKHLREIQERNKQKPTQKQRKKSIDRDSR